jgi:F420-non-reducing hydrogenase large subunit
MAQKIVIDPITRLEGHGKISIFLDDTGNVERAYFQVPELRGFEKFCEGRPAEDMPQITSRICGVCPTAHHMAGTKALDDLYKVEPTETAKKIRELVYNTFMLEDHALHFFFLGGPDFVTGPDAPKADRNILGVLQKVGLDVGKKVIGMRRELRELITEMGGKVIHPVLGLPGGVSKQMKKSGSVSKPWPRKVSILPYLPLRYSMILFWQIPHISISSPPMPIPITPIIWDWSMSKIRSIFMTERSG